MTRSSGKHKPVPPDDPVRRPTEEQRKRVNRVFDEVLREHQERERREQDDES